MPSYIQRSTPVAVNTDSDYSSFPAACKRHNGDFVVVYRGNATTHFLESGPDILMQVSTDTGATWAAKSTIQTAPAGRDYRDPGLLKLAATDKLLLTYTSAVSAGHSSGNLIRTVVSDDDGATWNTPVDITYSGQGDGYGITACSPLQLANGRILLAIYVTDSGRTNTNSYVYYSDDNAATWAFLSMCGDGNTDGRDYVEPSLALMPNGNVLTLLRQSPNKETWYATSTDSGATWSSAAKAFDSSGAPRVTVHDSKIYVFGRASNANLDKVKIFWTTQDRLAFGSWYGPWEWNHTGTTGALNYGHFIDDGTALYAVWSESQTASDSDVYFSKMADTVSDGTVLIADSFNRANSTTIGNTDGGSSGIVAAGKAWNAAASGTPRIQTNKLENNHATENAYVYQTSTGIQNFDLSVKLTPTTSYVAVKFRIDNLFNTATESGYQIALTPGTGNYIFQRLDAGTATALQTSSQGIAANTEYTVRVRAVGSQFQCYLNGSLVFTVTDSNHQGADHTWFMINFDNIATNSAKADDFTISAAINASAPITPRFLGVW